MIGYDEFDLMPTGIKNQIRMIQRVSVCVEVCAILLLVVMWVARIFHNLITGVAFSLILLLITTPLLLPGFLYDKVSQSTICFDADYIYILNKKRVCWREINRKTITAVRVEEISGFFYGHNKDLFRNKYICVFLNGATTIPSVPFANMFTEKDFIMFGYHADALQWLPRIADGSPVSSETDQIGSK